MLTLQTGIRTLPEASANRSMLVPSCIPIHTNDHLRLLSCASNRFAYAAANKQNRPEKISRYSRVSCVDKRTKWVRKSRSRIAVSNGTGEHAVMHDDATAEEQSRLPLNKVRNSIIKLKIWKFYRENITEKTSPATSPSHSTWSLADPR